MPHMFNNNGWKAGRLESYKAWRPVSEEAEK
jgi:hypothetical protein